MNYRLIALCDIEFSVPYAYRIVSANEQVQKSIQQNGVLEPIRVVKKEERFLLIDGFRRFRVAQKLGFSEIPAVVFPVKKLESVFMEALHLNLLGTGLSLIEKLRAYQISLFFGNKNLVRKISEFLGFGKIPHIEQIAAEVTGQPEWLQEYFHRQNFQLRVLNRLRAYFLPEYEMWFSIAAQLNLNGQELTSLLEQVQDICLRDRVTPVQFWEQIGLEKLLRQRWTPQQKSREIKMKVKEKRFPILTRIESEMQEGARQIEKPFAGNLQISWDRSLERPGLSFHLHLPEENSAVQLLETLADKKLGEQIISLLKKMNQLPEDMK